MEDKRKAILEAYKKNFTEKVPEQLKHLQNQSEEEEQETKRSDQQSENQLETEGIDVNFQLATPAELYKSSLTNMLKQCSQDICKESFDQLAYEIIEQDWLGVIVEIEDDEIEGPEENPMKNVYGVATILKVDDYLDRKFWKEYNTFVKVRCGEKDKRLQDVHKNFKGLGLLVVERFYNLPMHLHKLMLAQLVKDREWAHGNCIDEEDKASYEFENILYVFRCQKRIPKKQVEDKVSKKLKSDQPKGQILVGSTIEEEEMITEEELRFYSEQDEDLYNAGEVSFIIQMKIEPHNTTEYYDVAECRGIVVLPYSKYAEINDPDILEKDE